MMPYLAGIYIYPIKSLDRLAVTKATILPSGALAHDREFAIFDEHGKFVNGKRHAKVHLLRSSLDLNGNSLSLSIQGTNQSICFDLKEECKALEAWLSDYFGFPVKFIQNSMTGFPDDTLASGPTIISAETIAAVTSWFPGISIDDMRLRLRTNLEIAGVPAFWEDQLFTEVGYSIQFQIGDVLFAGINPCQRCVVPTRNSMTSEVTANFQKTFIVQRQESLPPWTATARFNHFYRLAVNTIVPSSEAGKVLRVGQEVKIIGISLHYS